MNNLATSGTGYISVEFLCQRLTIIAAFPAFAEYLYNMCVFAGFSDSYTIW